MARNADIPDKNARPGQSIQGSPGRGDDGEVVEGRLSSGVWYDNEGHGGDGGQAEDRDNGIEGIRNPGGFVAHDEETPGQRVDLSVIRSPNQELAASAVAQFRKLASESGYDIDDLRMTFAGMAIAALVRDEMSPSDIAKTIGAIREAAALMGVDSKPLDVRRRAEAEADLIIDAINPRIEGLLAAIERGKHAAEAEPEGAGSTATAYAEVQK